MPILHIVVKDPAGRLISGADVLISGPVTKSAVTDTVLWPKAARFDVPYGTYRIEARWREMFGARTYELKTPLGVVDIIISPMVAPVPKPEPNLAWCEREGRWIPAGAWTRARCEPIPPPVPVPPPPPPPDKVPPEPVPPPLPPIPYWLIAIGVLAVAGLAIAALLKK